MTYDEMVDKRLATRKRFEVLSFGMGDADYSECDTLLVKCTMLLAKQDKMTHCDNAWVRDTLKTLNKYFDKLEKNA